MSYIKDTLLPDERLVYYTGPHFIIFFPCVFWLLLAVAILFLVPQHPIFSYATLVIAGAYAITCYISFISAEYAVTNKRVLIKVGFIRRNSLEIFFHKIESIITNQSICGRIFNYGTVIISGTGGSKDPFCYIPNPLEFRRQVQTQMEHLLQEADKLHLHERDNRQYQQ